MIMMKEKYYLGDTDEGSGNGFSVIADFDGNELLLSDVLGSDADAVHENIEQDDEKQVVYGDDDVAGR